MTWAGVQLRHEAPVFWDWEQAARATGVKREPPPQPEPDPEDET